jgi:hypothetical protein
MNEDTATAIEGAIERHESEGAYTDVELPEELAGTEYVTGDEKFPNRCQYPGCRKEARVVERSGGTVELVCRREDHPHQFSIDSAEYTYYDLDFEAFFEAVTEELAYDLAHVELDLPRRATAYTESGLRITIPVAPANTEQELMSIYAEALRDDQPTLLLTTTDGIDALLELASVFATGSLVYAAPISALGETSEHITTMTQTARDIRAKEQAFIDERYDDPDPLVNRVNLNPRYVLTELNQMRLLRQTGQLSGGDRLETVVELAFSHLFSTYPGEGGEDDSGNAVPDNLFYIPALGADYESSILGVVDAKSGDTANFGREEARGKHDEYLDRAEREEIAADRVAHVFVILEFDGQQELNFFEKMEEFYNDDTHLVIVTADALAVLMAAYLAATISNELELADGDFRKAIYPLFDPKLFREHGLKRKARPVGQAEDEYRDAYLQREDLLIVHRELVTEWLDDLRTSKKGIESIFQEYFSEQSLL